MAAAQEGKERQGVQVGKGHLSRETGEAWCRVEMMYSLTQAWCWVEMYSLTQVRRQN